MADNQHQKTMADNQHQKTKTIEIEIIETIETIETIKTIETIENVETIEETIEKAKVMSVADLPREIQVTVRDMLLDAEEHPILEAAKEESERLVRQRWMSGRASLSYEIDTYGWWKLHDITYVLRNRPVENDDDDYGLEDEDESSSESDDESSSESDDVDDSVEDEDE